MVRDSVDSIAVVVDCRVAEMEDEKKETRMNFVFNQANSSKM